jgi:hypothetical protein
MEGIVSKRVGSAHVSGRTDSWIMVKNPAAPAVIREREDCGKKDGGDRPPRKRSPGGTNVSRGFAV